MSVALDPAATYRQEAAELLEQLEETLLDLEVDPSGEGLVDKAFRALHTIKGSGAMFGFDAVAAFTHHLETAFDAVRSGKRLVTPELVSLTLASLDHIRTLIDTPDTADPAAGQALLDGLAQTAPQASHPVPAPVKKTGAADDDKPEMRTWRIRIKLAEQVMSCGTNPLLLLAELRGLGECTLTALTDSVPALDTLDPVACYMTWDVVLTTTRPKRDIEDVFIFVADDSKIIIEPVETDTNDHKLGQILVQRGDVAPEVVESVMARVQPLGAMLVQEGKTTPDRVNSALAEQQHVRAKATSGEATASVRVPAERLDSLMDQVGELVIAQARLRQIAASSEDIALRANAEEIERLVSDLRDTAVGIRMLPIGTLFSRFRRVVRDLSQSLHKHVALVTEGEETELDKTVIESLADPLVHLIRNCIDHGIESPEDRERLGKPVEGTIRLSALHAGAQVLITIVDDGKGLDRDAIRHKAEERGLLAPGAAATDQELFGFIFHPGFSTAKQLSSVSGRGVGMDVVRKAIDALRGSIEIDSVQGEGTTITLRLPLTLAIIDGLLVRIGDARYVVPLAAVDECVDLPPDHEALHSGRQLINLRGDMVPFIRLRDFFSVEGDAEGYQKIVIAALGGNRVGLVVDHVIGQYQTVIKSLSRLLDHVQYFSGATILGDGAVALIIDIPELIRRVELRERVGE
jgi:two-component system chemotaxis sensor kinase CheA